MPKKMHLTLSDTKNDSVHAVASLAQKIDTHLSSHQVLDVREMLWNWINLAAAPSASEELRIAALKDGISPVLKSLGDAVAFQRANTHCSALGEEFIKRSEQRLSAFLNDDLLPPAEVTLEALLVVAEGMGQASADVRREAFRAYREACDEFKRINGYVPNETQERRASVLRGEFKGVETWREELQRIAPRPPQA